MPDGFPLAERVICAPFEEAIDRLAITPYDFVAVMTRGHVWDGVCLRRILKGNHARLSGNGGIEKKDCPAARAAGGGRI